MLPRRRDRPRRISPAILLAVELGLATAPTSKPRKAGLRRSGPIRSKPVFISPEDLAHLHRVAQLQCWAIGKRGHVCGGDVVAHHAGLHGTGIKSLHTETVPLCCTAHDELHETRGWCEGMDKYEIREMENVAIWETQTLLGVPITVSPPAYALVA